MNTNTATNNDLLKKQRLLALAKTCIKKLTTELNTLKSDKRGWKLYTSEKALGNRRRALIRSINSAETRITYYQHGVDKITGEQS